MRRIELEKELSELRQKLSQLREVEQECHSLQQVNQELNVQVQCCRLAMADLRASMSWRLVHRLHCLGAKVAPPGSTRRQMLMKTVGMSEIAAS